ncbi:MAG: polymerase [Novosphingobium lindaniclasticum]|jgi:DNA polymerase-4|uniref:DNA polymerase IV n=1 Tax=Novosphingobium lindaniclasticum TaxID=1329895 RepID=UPI00240A8128|nr:DNA polymerase IV [Novosphingobium lindaniclasticum]MDF2639935.1 polymerase [Novosphingobium lindaniclasticum]
MVDSPIRKIIHVDMDAFFASVEQRDDPSLRGRPVAVGHGASRGVVAAASYEARKFGVKSALASVTALRRCPELIFVRPRFEVYKDVSGQIHEIFARYTDLIQPLSLDEAYLDVTANKAGIETAWKTAKAIRAAILEDTGLTASAGISYNKFLAKLASDHRKPNGQFAVTPDMGEAWVETLPVSRFHGVGPVTANKMKRLGIESGADLRTKSMEFLQRNFGSSAEWYFAIARGIDNRPVNPNRIRKSSGSETTFDRDLTEPGEIEVGILKMADDVWRWCDSRKTFGRTVTVKIKYGDFQQITRSRTQPSVIVTQENLRRSAIDLARTVLPPVKGIRLVGVTVSNFGEASAQGSTAGETKLPIFAESQAA